VNSNTAATDGGGIYNAGTLTLVGTVTGVQVKFNIPDDIAP
jgi:predicted outer membrane repeat protein